MADDPAVLAILADDSFLHVGEPKVLLDHLRTETDGTPPPAFEFYDGDGRRLEPVLDNAGVATGFAPVAGQPDPSDADRVLLVDRIDAVLARVQVRLSREVLSDLAAQETPEHRRLPRVSGHLPDVLIALDALIGGPPPDSSEPNRGSWGHNAMHLLGLA